MRVRPALTAAVVAVVAVGSFSPALAGPAPKEIKGSWTANAFPPEPTRGGHCDTRIPQARATYNFLVPGPGTLTMELHNKLDWSADLRAAKDGDVLIESDGSLPTSSEGAVFKFTKKTAIIMGACNLGGEPSLVVTYSFKPKKK